MGSTDGSFRTELSAVLFLEFWEAINILSLIQISLIQSFSLKKDDSLIIADISVIIYCLKWGYLEVSSMLCLCG